MPKAKVPKCQFRGALLTNYGIIWTSKSIMARKDYNLPNKNNQ